MSFKGTLGSIAAISLVAFVGLKACESADVNIDTKKLGDSLYDGAKDGIKGTGEVIGQIGERAAGDVLEAIDPNVKIYEACMEEHNDVSRCLDKATSKAPSP